MRRPLAPALYALASIALLCIGGLLLQPLSRKLHRAEAQVGLSQPQLTGISSKDVLSEQLSFFMLGGLRSLAAEILVLDATSAWMKKDWVRVERRWHLITLLCPQRHNYWINAGRDMAVNAASHAANNPHLTPHEQVSLSRSYISRGIKFLRDGLSHLPHSALLYTSLGDTYADLNRRPNFSRAAEAYHQAVQNGASALYQRNEFYSLCRIRGREKEAWELGRKLYDNPSQRLPSLRCLLFVLQQKLDVPAAEKLSVIQLFGSQAKARTELARFERNQLRFPVNGIREYLLSAAE